MSSDARSRPGYFAALAAAAATLLAAIAGLNFVMDPFAVWRHPWPGVNDYHPWLNSGDLYRLVIAVHRPRTMVLGTSHVIVGFDPDSPAGQAWGRPLVESDLQANFDVQLGALEAASQRGGLQTALVELDPREMMACQQRMPDVGLGQALARVLLFPALLHSLEALAMNLRADAGAPPHPQFQRASGVVTPGLEPPSWVFSHVGYILGFLDDTPGQRCDYRDATLGMARLAQMSALAKARRFQLVFFLVPARTSTLMAADRLGYWPRIDALKQRLAGFAQASGLPVWDFTNAALRPAAKVTDADFYDTIHFRRELGGRMLTTMRRGGPGDALGVRLDSSNVEAIVLADRQAVAEAIAKAPVTPPAAARNPPDR